MKNLFCLASLCLFLLSSALNAQINEISNNTLCGTTMQDIIPPANDLGPRLNLMADPQCANFQSIQNYAINNPNPTPKLLPLVFHIINNGHEDYLANIDPAIYTMVKSTNGVFKGLNSDACYEDTGIQFRLATLQMPIIIGHQLKDWTIA